MTSLFSKPKAPDTSKQQKLLQDQEARLQQQESETRRRDQATLNARRGRNAARASLITGGEQGVLRETLG